MKKRILVSVSNDLARDQRVKKQCAELEKDGYEVVLIGRKRPNSIPISRPYKTVRLGLLFHKGALFYAFLNLRLFWYLLTHKADLLWANDLDTLLANCLVAKLKGIPLIYDSHEYFTEVPEIQHKRVVKRVWATIEKMAIGRCNVVLTVSPAIVEKLQERYELSEVNLVRNVPVYVDEVKPYSRKDMGIDADVGILIMQGNGINMDRGGEELIQAMAKIEHAILLIIGRGDSFGALREMAAEKKVQDKVKFIDSLPYKELLRYTAAADIGLSLDKGSNLNYRFSLPNKIFDYALGGTAVVASDLPEVGRVVRKYNLGALCSNVTPEEIARVVNQTLANKEQLRVFGENGRNMVKEVNWEKEFRPILAKLKHLA